MCIQFSQLLTYTNYLHLSLLQGNQVNRVVILDGKVIDYINFILRTDTFEGCSLSDTLKLYKSIADLLIAMTEESSPEAFRVAKVYTE